jgi:hypothetical protein
MIIIRLGTLDSMIAEGQLKRFFGRREEVNEEGGPVDEAATSECT